MSQKAVNFTQKAAARVGRATKWVEQQPTFKETADYGARVRGSITSLIGSGISGLITGNAAGSGKYTGKSFTDTPGGAGGDVSASGALAEADFGTLAAADDCLVLNPVELGSSNTGHDVTQTANTGKFAIYFTGRLVRINSDGKKVVHAMLFFAGCS
jgi:hypothetical protein